MNGKARILVVDDEEMNRDILKQLLEKGGGYEVHLAADGMEAIQLLALHQPDVVLLDVMLPIMNGIDIARRIKSDAATCHIPIVMITALQERETRVHALEVGVDDFISKPVDEAILCARVKSLIKVKAYNDHLREREESLNARLEDRTLQLADALEKVQKVSLETIYRLTRTAEYRDEDTGMHVQRMSEYAAAIARRMDLGEEMVNNLLFAAPMHDLGKVGIPDRILLKPGKLTAEEYNLMKRHTVIGMEILEGSQAEFIQLGAVIARSHHEKWNGAGYPDGLAREDIPLVGRISAIADVFDALTSQRPYKKPFPIEKSLEIIRSERAAHFDPDVVDAFFEIHDEILAIKRTHQDQSESHLWEMTQSAEMAASSNCA